MGLGKAWAAQNYSHVSNPKPPDPSEAIQHGEEEENSDMEEESDEDNEKDCMVEETPEMLQR